MSCSAVLFVAAVLAVQPSSSGDTEYARMTQCLIAPVDGGDVQVPAREAGALVHVAVQEGTIVEKGAALARVDDANSLLQKTVAERQLKVAREQATNDINVKAAKAAADVSEAELRESLEVNAVQPGAIPSTRIRREELTAERAKLQTEVAELEQYIASLTADVRESEVDVAANAVERRQVLSPLDGIVVQMFRHQGEWVNPGDPVVRVVRMDRLRVQGFLDADQFSRAEVDGQPVVVRVRLKYGEEEFKGQIGFVSPIEEASGEYRVWAEVENRPHPANPKHWILSPGETAEMTVELKSLGR